MLLRNVSMCPRDPERYRNFPGASVAPTRLISGTMLIARTRADLQAALADLPGRALVPTMGALHDGHLALVRAARAQAPVVTSIFVNPTQFGPNEDLARYPRDEPGDLARLRDAGCDLAFLPEVATIYPPDDASRVEVAGPALGWEGARRPGHFSGVATVVTRLFGLVRPRFAWFGEKDWQQLQVVRRMTEDLCLGVEINALPTVRAGDGLALSSRNRYLSAAERALAAALPRTCLAAIDAMRAGKPVPACCADAAASLSGLGFAVDYLALVDPASLREQHDLASPARLIVAARLGPVRLLDNFPV